MQQFRGGLVLEAHGLLYFSVPELGAASDEGFATAVADALSGRGFGLQEYLAHKRTHPLRILP